MTEKEPSSKKPKKTRQTYSLSLEERHSLYARSRELPKSLRLKFHFLSFNTSFDDPFLESPDPDNQPLDVILAPWEPNLSDGPTSSRFAVVDFNADQQNLEPPAVWKAQEGRFEAASQWGQDQVSIWALLQRAMDMFQNDNALGRVIPWGFDGSRLILVPHAGYDHNAYYDRQSKSLQFYYYENSEGKTEYTCRSIHIVAHEFGHAVLDGIRPRLFESISIESNAFHEFFGDLSALLVCLEDKYIRQKTAQKSNGSFETAEDFQQLAQRFGQALEGRPYLRSFKNQETMKTMAGQTSHHDLSQVLSGAVFDILTAIGRKLTRSRNSNGEFKTPNQVFWLATNTIRRLTLQSLDLLPPIDIDFRDYAFAICRWHQYVDPRDTSKLLPILCKAFRYRGIFDQQDEDSIQDSASYVLDNLLDGSDPARAFQRLMFRFCRLKINRTIEQIIESPESAYRLLDDNREELLIPLGCDFQVIDLYETYKADGSNQPLGRQYVLQYLWSEDVELSGDRFGQYESLRTPMLCGGTLVLDRDGNILSWSAKPGSQPYGGTQSRTGRLASFWKIAIGAGKLRRESLLDDLAQQIASGQIGSVIGSPMGILSTGIPPLMAEPQADGLVRFERAPHGHFSNHRRDPDLLGERPWILSF